MPEGVAAEVDDLTRIDDGPVATVYTGLHAGVPVALKVFPKRFDKRTMSAFGKERAKLATVRRVTSILMVDGVDEVAPGRPALRMELCTQSLSALVERVGQLAAPDVVVLGRAVALALAAAHGAGVVHGGVAPNNVLFRANAEPVLADFGVTLRQAFTRDPLYAIEFLPPETLRTGTLDESTDLYGLGAVLHFALTARSPHPGRLGEQPGERVLRILGEPVPAITRTDVPTGLSTLVARLLSASPDRRPASAADVAAQLTAMLPTPHQTPHPPEPWDDFDAAAPPPPPLPSSPPALLSPSPSPGRPVPPRTTSPDHDDWDDFAVPPAAPAPWQGRKTGPSPQAHPPARSGTAGVPAAPAPRAADPTRPGPDAGRPSTDPTPAPGHLAPGQQPQPHVTGQQAQLLAGGQQIQLPVAGRQPEPSAGGQQVEPAVTGRQPQPSVSGQVLPAVAGQQMQPAVAGQQAQLPVAGQQAQALASGQQPQPSVGGRQPELAVSGQQVQPAAMGQQVQPLAGGQQPQPSVGGQQVQSAVAGQQSQPSAAVVGQRLQSPVGVSSPSDVGGRAEAPSGLGGPRVGVTLSEADDAFWADDPPALLPLAAPPVAAADVMAGVPTEVLPQQHTVRLQQQAAPDQDDFDFVGPPVRRRAAGVRVLAGPLTPPGQQPKKLIRYDLLAGAALLLALLALVPLLLLRGDPEEMSSAPQVPQAPERSAPDVNVELDPPVELEGQVKLTWEAPSDLDFAVVVAAEGRATRTLLAQRNHSLTVEVEPDLRYCFQVQASDGDDVYTSDPVPFRGATCRE